VKKAHKNITLCLPDALLRRFKIYAAAQNRSMTQLAAEAIERMLEQQQERDQMKKRLIEGMRNAPNLGTGGVIPWTRDEIHERTFR
jgi:predicted transcriptional regulator